jgi:hypothetical protein
MSRDGLCCVESNLFEVNVLWGMTCGMSMINKVSDINLVADWDKDVSDAEMEEPMDWFMRVQLSKVSSVVVSFTFNNFVGCGEWINSKIVMVDSFRSAVTSVNSTNETSSWSKGIVVSIGEDDTVFTFEQRLMMRTERQVG